jgi:hypothetical protein
MPRYYFHLEDGGFSPDRDGTDIDEAADVRDEAIRMAGEVVRDLGAGWGGTEWKMHVTDGDADPVLTLTFSALDHRR